MDWARRWKDDPKSTLAQREIAYILLEGLFFQSSFAAIFYFKEQGLLLGLAQYNEWIARDETIHTLMWIYLHNHWTVHRLDEPTIHSMFREAVDLELEFATKVLPVSMAGINAEMMQQYIKYYADVLLKFLHVSPMYNVTNPFPFMVQQGIDGKANFFERDETAYGRGINPEQKRQKDLLTVIVQDNMFEPSLGGF